MEKYKQGRKLLDEGNCAGAKAYFMESAAPEAIYGLFAVAVITGTDRKCALEQLAKVLPLLEKQAESGNIEDCFILGRCYEIGVVVENDSAKAMNYYTRAGLAGHTDAMFNLGCMFMHKGPENGNAGAYWFQQAASLGHTEALQALSYWRQHC